ncbi:MAG: TraR/DksA family transcriptional regulator [Candidatus Staskawiczbacteria bacterium]|nr:TraR/DksA family transcriptional regulator [Candidatus Staskawiczbacteria bacterium]
MNKEIIEKLKDKLVEEKSSLEKELSSFATKDKVIDGNWKAKYPNKEDNIDSEEEAEETSEYDNLLSLEQSLELKLKDINLALGKITSGSYGKCERCGKDIEEERLVVCPESKLCIECNKQA